MVDAVERINVERSPAVLVEVVVGDEPDLSKERLGLIAYYDLDKDGWRSFYIYSLNQIDHVWPFNYDVFLGQKSQE